MSKKQFTPLQKKLTAYGSLAAAMIAATNVDAQIVYHDVIPDRVLTNQGDSMHVDLNNDGIVDFIFSKAGLTTNGTVAGVTPINANALAGSTSTYNTNSGATGPRLYPFDFIAGAPIDQNLSWYSINQLLFQSNGGNSIYFVPPMGYTYDGLTSGNWPDGNDHFLPVKVIDGANTYYGWVRCNVAPDVSTLTIESWGIQMTSGTAIDAGEGETSTAVSNVQHDAIKIFSFNKEVYVMNPSVNENGMNIHITNMLGQEVKNINSNQSQVHIDASDLSSGVYMVVVKNGNEITSQKVSIR